MVVEREMSPNDTFAKRNRHGCISPQRDYLVVAFSKHDHNQCVCAFFQRTRYSLQSCFPCTSLVTVLLFSVGRYRPCSPEALLPLVAEEVQGAWVLLAPIKECIDFRQSQRARAERSKTWGRHLGERMCHLPPKRCALSRCGGAVRQHAKPRN